MVAGHYVHFNVFSDEFRPAHRVACRAGLFIRLDKRDTNILSTWDIGGQSACVCPVNIEVPIDVRELDSGWYQVLLRRLLQDERELIVDTQIHELRHQS